MKIRPAGAGDLHEVQAMAIAFAEAAPHQDLLPVRRDLVAASVLAAFSDGIVWVTERDQDDGQPGLLTGFLAVAALTHPLTGQFMLSEVALWVKPFYRRGRTLVRLLRAAEECASVLGASVIRMGAISPEFSGYLTRLGYRLVETHHIKRVTETGDR